MKKFPLIAAVLLGAVIVSVLGSALVAQAPGTAAVPLDRYPSKIAVLNLAEVFEKDPQFKTQTDQLKTQVKDAETKVNTEREQITSLIGQLKDLTPGTANFRTMEEQIAKRRSDLEFQVKRQQRDFMQYQGRIYQDIYSQIQQEVNALARQQGIDLVLRYSQAPIDLNNPNTVLENINRQVVWYGPHRDITATIIRNLALRRVDPRNTGGAAAATVGSRQAVPGRGTNYQR